MSEKMREVGDFLKGGRLIVVSNAEPYKHVRERGVTDCLKGMGGLVSALDPIMQDSGGLWIAWGNERADFEVVDESRKMMVPPEAPAYTLKRVNLNEAERKKYYHGFSNSVLWPLFHNFLDKTQFEHSYWGAYNKVNKKFADAVLEEVKKDDVVWVQDYHLCLLPEMLKEENPDLKVGFFWHIPWCPWEIYRAMPWRGEILRGILSSDFVGFHTQRYVENFLSCAKKELNCTVEKENLVLHQQHKSQIGAFPLGTDYEKYAKLSSRKDVVEMSERLKNKLNIEYIVYSKERLDYTKGAMHRLEAIEVFLEKYKRFHERVIFVLGITPSRTETRAYRKTKRAIDEHVGRINGKFQKANWVPIRYFYRYFSDALLVAYYKAADVMLVTPLIDGMNLAGKEYVASKNGSLGTLILSEFAGAAEEMGSGALIVNPYNVSGVAATIKMALEMGNDEKRRRMDTLLKIVKERDLSWWLNCYFKEWMNVYTQDGQVAE